jgi:hypothetical protein
MTRNAFELPRRGFPQAGNCLAIATGTSFLSLPPPSSSGLTPCLTNHNLNVLLETPGNSRAALRLVIGSYEMYREANNRRCTSKILLHS